MPSKPPPKPDPNAPRYVSIPESEREAIVILLHERHGVNLDPGEVFTFDGRLSHGGVQVRVTLSDAQESDVLDLEARMDLDFNDVSNPTDGRDALVDFLDELLSAYFEQGREMRFHGAWETYHHNDQTFQIRAQRTSPKLERMADALLRDAGYEDLV